MPRVFSPALSRLLRPAALGAALLLPAASAATLTLSAGQTGQLGDQRVTVVRVQDNRCPINARCIRAGELIVKVLVGQGRTLRFLTLELPAPQDAVWKGLRVLSAPGRATNDRRPVPVTFSDQP
ncbi:hypothetical protein [Deinococcus ficus]|uniref:hypothetical protein n=1 Tax=Deinococcus ficus TaxID=317577 RepID=UPI0019C70FB7|nr:hypothetical protein [Deinococcus ficus]GHF76889.1 hypothetical protein GCM10017782_13580 [Deinococcus ficus]